MFLKNIEGADKGYSDQASKSKPQQESRVMRPLILVVLSLAILNTCWPEKYIYIYGKVDECFFLNF